MFTKDPKPAEPAEPESTTPDPAVPAGKVDVESILDKAQDGYASDIHLVVGRPPMARYFGSLERIEGYNDPLTPNQIEILIDSILAETQRERFRKEREIDLSYQEMACSMLP